MPDKPPQVPLWVLRNAFMSYGSRMPQRPETLDPNGKNCEKCGVWCNGYKDWWSHKGKYYCKPCVEIARVEDPFQGYTYGLPARYQEARVEREFHSSTIPMGNLNENLYKYFAGSEFTSSLRSICRACGQIMHSATERIAHMDNSRTLYKNDMTCAHALVVAHKLLLKEGECLVCQNRTTRQKWGVPLCSETCIKVWKFDEHKVYEKMDRLLAPYWATTGDGGSIILASSLKPTLTQALEDSGE